MTRSEELAEIDRFLATRGVTRGPSAFAAPTTTSASIEEQAQRLRQPEIKNWTASPLCARKWRYDSAGGRDHGDGFRTASAQLSDEPGGGLNGTQPGHLLPPIFLTHRKTWRPQGD